MNKESYNLLTILGPTASGKTRLAVALANKYDGEIISADSRQIFRNMDIGTGKDLHEYGDVPHHLINIMDAGGEFSVFAFQRLFLDAFADIRNRHKLPILCGGTGMYLDAVLRGYRMIEVPEDQELRHLVTTFDDSELAEKLRALRPDLHNNTDLLDRQRTIRAIEIELYQKVHPEKAEPLPDIRPLIIGIHWERNLLRQRITERLKERLDSGMIEEVQQLHESGIPWSRLDYYGLEYRFLGAYLRGELNRNDLHQKLNSAINDFAKRQGNWFRRMEKHGILINWVEGAANPLAEAIEIIGKYT